MEDSSCHMESDTCGRDLVCFRLGSRAGVPRFPFLSASPPNSPSLYVSSAFSCSPSLPLSLLVGSVCGFFFWLHSYQGLSDKHGLILCS